MTHERDDYDNQEYATGGFVPVVESRVNNGMRKNWVGVIALIFGMMAVTTPILGLVYAVVAIVTGLRSRKWADTGEASNRALGTTGLVLGVVALVLGVLFLVLGGVAMLAGLSVDPTPAVPSQ